jgi:hypothetical protein
MYLFCNPRIHIITLYLGHVYVYYASMLWCWHLVWILVRTYHPCLGVGCHKPALHEVIAWGHARDGVMVRPARLHRRPRCSARGGDSTGERRWLHRARWGGEVLTGDGRRRWSGENGPVRRRSKAAAELRWPGRASMSPVVGGGDRGDEAQSKRDG